MIKIALHFPLKKCNFVSITSTLMCGNQRETHFKFELYVVTNINLNTLHQRAMLFLQNALKPLYFSVVVSETHSAICNALYILSTESYLYFLAYSETPQNTDQRQFPPSKTSATSFLQVKREKIESNRCLGCLVLLFSRLHQQCKVLN